MHIGPSFREVHTLDDGATVKLRHIRAEDADELHAAFHRLTPESRYRRFLSGAAELSDEMLRYLTEVDGIDHVALVAIHASLDLKFESIVGVGRFVRLGAEPHVAECAVTIVDDFQHRGLGRLLGERLVDAALERGITHFRAEVLTSNAPVRHLLEAAGALVREENADTILFDVDLAEVPHARTSMNTLLSAAATSMMVFMRRLAPPSEPPPRPPPRDGA